MYELISVFTVFIAIFLFGMTVMRIGLSNYSKEKLNNLLANCTNHPLKGLITGMIVTSILQSSSAVMVITIGLVAASYISFQQSIGIILGSNIGTTITTEIITIDLNYSIIPLLLIGALCILQKHPVLFSIGCTLFGLGCIFVAMNGFESLAAPLSSLSFVHNGLTFTNNSGLIGLLIGTILTAIIQSSTATTGIIMSFMNEHLLTLSAGTAIVLGSNIGTCITALLASIGSIREAKLTAYAHIWLNIFGVIIFFPLIGLLVSIAQNLTSVPDLQLAHISVIFNVLCSILALPFVRLFTAFILKFHGQLP